MQAEEDRFEGTRVHCGGAAVFVVLSAFFVAAAGLRIEGDSLLSGADARREEADGVRFDPDFSCVEASDLAYLGERAN